MDVCRAVKLRRVIKAFLLALVLITSTRYYVTHNQDVVARNIASPIEKNISQPSLPCPTNTGNQRLTVCPGDVILEKTALSFAPCTDANTAAFANKSNVFLQGGKLTYKEGDNISISVLLHDRMGRQKTVGGDHLRARLVGDDGKSVVTGIVFDHDNGSYTVQFEALFAGKLTVDVQLTYTRETISSLYRIRTQIPSTRVIVARFTNKNISEIGNCHTFPEKVMSSSGLCNLTFENSGMPWYCVKPKHPLLLCRDWSHVKTVDAQMLPYTDAEWELLTRIKESIPNDITISVKAMTPDELAKRPPLVPCAQYDTRKLWYKAEPTGFINKGRWELRHCEAKPLPDLKTCLRGKSVAIFGDSTSRDWFFELTRRLQCNVPLQSNTTKWHTHLRCVHSSLNVNVSWMPHSQPFSVGGAWRERRHTSYSISRYIDEEIQDDDQVVVVLHLFYHLVSYRHDVLLTKLRRIRESVERLLTRNRFVKVFLKGPHTYIPPAYKAAKRDDYFAYLYWNLWFHALEGLHDKVIYLDHLDISNAYKTQPVHPGTSIVSAMMDQLFSYVC